MARQFLSLTPELQFHMPLTLNHTFIDVALSAPLICSALSSSPSSADTAMGFRLGAPDLSAGTAFPVTLLVQPRAMVVTAASTRTAICWRTVASPARGHCVRQA